MLLKWRESKARIDKIHTLKNRAGIIENCQRYLRATNLNAFVTRWNRRQINEEIQDKQSGRFTLWIRNEGLAGSHHRSSPPYCCRVLCWLTVVLWKSSPDRSVTSAAALVLGVLGVLLKRWLLDSWAFKDGKGALAEEKVTCPVWDVFLWSLLAVKAAS